MRILRTTVWTAAVLLGLALVAAPAAADFVISDDLIVDGSACIGFDCVNGESFGFDTLRLKENNTRIRFFDTSNSASFPTRDWEITANDSSNGGAEKFSITDIDGGRIPFTIIAGARANAIFATSNRIGFGTANPVVELHVVDGDTPTLRLEQDGSSGFTPQTWDVAGNETNYFIRDVTNGSKLPFRIRPGASTSAIDISSTGRVGINTTTPGSRLHVLVGGSPFSFNAQTSIGLQNTATNADGVILSLMGGNATGNSQLAFGDSDNEFAGRMIYFHSDNRFEWRTNGESTAKMTLTAAGDLTLGAGNCSDVTGGGGCTPDYVFEPDYELMPLADLERFVTENKHLPNIPSADEVQQNGVNLRSMNNLLLEKIEELTLYTFQQQKTIDAQREMLAQLAEKVEALSAD